MSDWIEAAAAKISAKLPRFDGGQVEFAILGEGSLFLGPGGLGRLSGSGAPDLVLEASAADFRALFEGALAPAQAFLSGRLRVKGPMGLAMQLAQALSS